MVFLQNDWLIVAPLFLCFLIIFLLFAIYTPAFKDGGWYAKIWRDHAYLPAILIFLLWTLALIWLAGAWTEANITRYNTVLTALYTTTVVLIWAWNVLVFGDARFYWSMGVIILLLLTLIVTLVYQLTQQPQWFEILAISAILIWTSYCLFFNIQLLKLPPIYIVRPCCVKKCPAAEDENAYNESQCYRPPT